MPEKGEVRTSGGETRQWTGQGWRLMPASPTNEGREPDTFMGGFTKHLLEDEPAARNALLSGGALATGGMAVPLTLAAPVVGRGMSYLSQLFRGKNPLPATGSELVGDLAGDVATGVVDAYGGKALGAGVRGVRAVNGAVGETLAPALRSLLRMNPKAMAASAVTSEPVLGAAEQIATALSPNGFRDAARNVADGLTPGLPSGRYVVPKEIPYRMTPGKASTETRRAVQGQEMFNTGYGDVPNAERAARMPYNSAPTEASAPSMDVLHGGEQYHGGDYQGHSYEDIFGNPRQSTHVPDAARPGAYQPDMFDQQAIDAMPESMRAMLRQHVRTPAYQRLMQHQAVP